jgi:5-methyltetrahydropteroyltriglutamate--homocysteine methyltransferase
MELLTLSHGSYPRIGSTPDQQILRRALAKRDRGEKTGVDVRAAEDHMVLLALEEQQEAGIDIVTDGLIRWNDPISHLAGKLKGLRIDGLLRYFDTNFYFRQPIVDGMIKRSQPLIVDEFHWASQKSRQPVKPVVTGAYTLARLSLREGSARSMESVVISFAEALGQEVAELAAAGASLIQIDEPAVVKHPTDLRLASEALRKIAAHKEPAKLGLALYFGDAAPFYTTLQDLPFDILILDFIYSPKLPDVIEAEGSVKQIGFGLLDGRNTRLEDQLTVKRQLERMLRHVKSECSYLTTSCGLEYLPRDRAQLKLKCLTSLKRSFLGEGA